MGIIIGVLWVAAIIAVIAFIVTVVYSFSSDTTEVVKEKLNKLIKRASLPLVVLLALAVASSGLVQVSAGHRGVILRWGAVRTELILDEGLHLIVPVMDKMVEVTVQTLAYEAEAEAASKDLQDVKTSVTLNYNLEPSRTANVYQTLRQDWEVRIIKPAVQEAVKAVTARYLAEELITKRPDVKEAITTALTGRLDAFGIYVEAVSLTNFRFTEVFTASIEAKVVAVQQALQAENKLKQVEWEAKQAQTAAVGKANAAIAEAEGQAKAITIVATATAEGNKLVESTLTPEVLRYLYLKYLNPNVSVVYIPSDAAVILNPEK